MLGSRLASKEDAGTRMDTTAIGCLGEEEAAASEVTFFNNEDTGLSLTGRPLTKTNVRSGFDLVISAAAMAPRRGTSISASKGPLSPSAAAFMRTRFEATSKGRHSQAEARRSPGGGAGCFFRMTQPRWTKDNLELE